MQEEIENKTAKVVDMSRINHDTNNELNALKVKLATADAEAKAHHKQHKQYEVKVHSAVIEAREGTS